MSLWNELFGQTQPSPTPAPSARPKFPRSEASASPVAMASLQEAMEGNDSIRDATGIIDEAYLVREDERESARFSLPKVMVGFCLAFATLLAAAGCGTSAERVQIPVPTSVKQAIDAATPAGQYGYYALKTASPAKVEDLAGMTLLVCGGNEAQDNTIILKVVSSSMTITHAFLFKSSMTYWVSPNMSNADGGTESSASKSGTATVQGASFSMQGETYPSNVSSEMLLSRCVDAMRSQPATVLLTKRGTSPGRQGEFVEITFK